MTLRTRIAPTPSGFLHAGNGISFILTYTIARAFGGTILLRIDDLDAERIRPHTIFEVGRNRINREKKRVRRCLSAYIDLVFQEKISLTRRRHPSSPQTPREQVRQ